MRAGPLDDELANLVGHGHHLDDGDAAGVAGVFAALTAPATVERHTFKKGRVDAQILVHLGRISNRLLADRADSPHEPLSGRQDDRRGNQEGRDAHVVEARDGPGSVIAVHGAQHLVAGERGFDGDLSSLLVADFADHDDVRVLSQNGTQRVGERQTDFLFGRHLIDPWNLEFYGVFHRNDVVFGIIEFVERRIKRSGLPGAGRASDQNQTVRGVHGGLEPAERVLIQAEFVQTRRKIGLVQNTQHALLAVDRRHKRDPQINVAAADPDAHASVLGQTALGDVEVAHDFEPRRQRHLHVFGRRRHVHQRTVYAITQADSFLERFNVNIARAILDRLHDDEVGELDDGSFLGGGRQLVDVHFLGHFARDFERVRLSVVFGLALRVLDDVFHRAATAVQVVQLVKDGLFRRDHRHDLQLRGALHVVEGENIQRVGHRQE